MVNPRLARLCMKWRKAMLAAAMVCILPPALATDSDDLQSAKRAVVARHPEEALKIWQRLAATGNAEAQYQLAAALQAGRWLPEDLATARRWYTAAAEQDHIRAQYALAGMCAQGEGGALDRVCAKRWYAAAAESGHPAARKQLEALGAAASSEDLLGAVRRGDLALVASILSGQPSLEAVDGQQKTAFLLAAEQGSVDVLNALQRAGADMQRRDAFGNTALLLAVRQGHLPATRWLLGRGAAADAADRQGNTALMLASRRGDLAFVDALLGQGADPNRSNEQGQSAMQLATQGQHRTVVKRLKAAGGREPMTVTVRRTVDRMDPNKPAADQAAGWPPLALAAWRGQDDLVRDLLKRGARVDAEDAEQHTALTRAAMRGHTKVISTLLRAGADPEHSSGDGRTALLHAAASGSPDSVKALRSADFSHRDSGVVGVFELALQSGSEDTVLMILDLQGKSPAQDQLAALIAADMQQATQRLLSAYDLSQAERNSALAAAIARAQSPLAKELLRRGADPNTRSQEVPVLELAIANGDTSLVAALLEAGANPEMAGATPALAIAAIAGQVEIVQRLLEAGVAVDARDAHNSTPLLLAVQAERIEVVKELLKAGANRRTRNRDGDSAASLARRSTNPAMQKLFKADDDGLFSGWGND